MTKKDKGLIKFIITISIFFLIGITIYYLLLSDFADKILVAVGFIIIILSVVIPVCIIHLIIKFVQNKMQFKYRLNFIKLFLIFILLVILLLCLWALKESDSPSEFIHGLTLTLGFFLFVLSSAIDIAKGVIVKVEDKEDKDGKEG